MSLASVTIAFLAAAIRARPRPTAEPDPRLAALESENARLRSDLSAAQQTLTWAQSRLAAIESQVRYVTASRRRERHLARSGGRLASDFPGSAGCR